VGARVRTQAEVQERLVEIEAAVKQEPLPIAKATLEAVAMQLRWVLDKWPYPHVFKICMKTSGEQQSYCEWCGRDLDDPLHTEVSDDAS